MIRNQNTTLKSSEAPGSHGFRPAPESAPASQRPALIQQFFEEREKKNLENQRIASETLEKLRSDASIPGAIIRKPQPYVRPSKRPPDSESKYFYASPDIAEIRRVRERCSKIDTGGLLRQMEVYFAALAMIDGPHAELIPIHRIDADNKCSCGKHPCRHRGRHPAIPIEQAVGDTESIGHIWSDYSWVGIPNLGLIMGSGLFALRVRVDLLEQLDAETSAAPTFRDENQVPVHQYFLFSGQSDLELRSMHIGDGIDLLAEDEVFAIPPSVFGNTKLEWIKKPYEQDPATFQIKSVLPPPPLWVLEKQNRGIPVMISNSIPHKEEKDQPATTPSSSITPCDEQAQIVFLKRTKKRQAIFEVMMRVARPMGPTEIARALPESDGVSRKVGSVKMALKELSDAGVVEKDDKGHYVLAASMRNRKLF